MVTNNSAMVTSMGYEYCIGYIGGSAGDIGETNPAVVFAKLGRAYADVCT